MSAFISGISLGLSLIVAIGAQNSFVLKQGLKQEFVFIICLICALSDAILIILGVSGFDAIVPETPWIEEVIRYGGELFILGYGLRSFWMAAKSSDSLLPSTGKSMSLALAVTACLAFTWLNPHFYLDGLIIASISTHYPDTKIQFAGGIISASFAFLFALGYGAKMLTPVFSKPVSWKILDVIIGIVMCLIAMNLYLGFA